MNGVMLAETDRTVERGWGKISFYMRLLYS